MVKQRQQITVSSRRATRWEFRAQNFMTGWREQPFVKFREQEEHRNIINLISINSSHTPSKISSLRGRITKISNAEIDTQTAKLRDEWNYDI